MWKESTSVILREYMCIILYVSEKKSKILLKTILEKLIKTEQEVKLKEKRKNMTILESKYN